MQERFQHRSQCKRETWFDRSKTHNEILNSYCYFIIAQLFSRDTSKISRTLCPHLTNQKRVKSPGIHLTPCCLWSHRTEEIPELAYLTTWLVVVAVQLGGNNRVTQGGFYNHFTKIVIRSKWKSRGSFSQWKNKISKYTEKTSKPLSSTRNPKTRQNSSNLLTFFCWGGSCGFRFLFCLSWNRSCCLVFNNSEMYLITK